MRIFEQMEVCFVAGFMQDKDASSAESSELAL
jgi:hypothetical protein